MASFDRLRGLVAVLAVLELAACGRIGFTSVDPHGDQGDDDAAIGVDDAPTDVAIPTGLRIWFRLVAPDLLIDTVSGRQATCTECPLATTIGSRQAAQFDGVDDCMSFADQGAGEATVFTLAAWFYRADTTAGMVVAKERVAGNNWNSWQLNVVPTDVQFGHYDGLGLGYLTIPASATSWHHVAGTYNGVAQTDEIYVDGVRVDNAVGSSPPPFDGNPVKIGCDIVSGSLAEPFHGAVADVRFYDRVLTAPEIAALAMP